MMILIKKAIIVIVKIKQKVKLKLMLVLNVEEGGLFLGKSIILMLLKKSKLIYGYFLLKRKRLIKK